MIFYKTVTCGNDFLHIDQKVFETSRTGGLKRSELSQRLCCRNEGAGADGVVFYNTTHAPEKIGFEIFNRDGSKAELSGNGMAGLTALLLYQNATNKNHILLETPTGLKKHFLLNRDNNNFHLKIEIGCPDFTNLNFFPFLKKNKKSYRYKNIEFYPVSIGNPHVVVLEEHPFEGKTERLKELGEMLEAAEIFPYRTNVEFIIPGKSGPVDYRRGENFQVFFYERGVGPTVSSSTGSAAIFALLREIGHIEDSLILKIPQVGDSLKLTGKSEIYIESYTKIVYKGIYLDI